MERAPFDHSPHGKNQEGNSQSHTHPKAPLHRTQLRVVFLMGTGKCHAQLQGHPANRTASWLIADDLRVHRTGVLHRLQRLALEGHATHRPTTGLGLAHIRIHWAHIDCAICNGGIPGGWRYSSGREHVKLNESLRGWLWL